MVRPPPPIKFGNRQRAWTERAEVVTGGGDDGIGAVALVTSEVVAVHTVLGLDVADHRLDRGPALHFAADRLGEVNAIRPGNVIRLNVDDLPHVLRNRNRAIVNGSS